MERFEGREGLQAAEIRELKQQLAELSDRKREIRSALAELENKHQLLAQR